VPWINGQFQMHNERFVLMYPDLGLAALPQLIYVALKWADKV